MKKTILALSLAGLAFSGYLSGVKFFSGTCALNESCPYFLGYPACYYGFAMYLALTIFAGLYLQSRINEKSALRALASISFMGILFAGYFTIGELPLLFSKGLSAYVLGLPICALGLIFYIAIFALSLKSQNK
ncbi:MAG: hypothetical protein AAB482_00970 [Patescibacteria group bacterium]